MYPHVSGAASVDKKWSDLDLLQPGHGAGASSCRGFCSVPAPLETVQRAELWCVILSFQAMHAVRVGVDCVTCCWACGTCEDVRPSVWMNDGDLIALVHEMVSEGREGTARVTKVKDHVDEETVLLGLDRLDDRFGNDLADEAADFGPRCR